VVVCGEGGHEWITCNRFEARAEVEGGSSVYRGSGDGDKARAHRRRGHVTAGARHGGSGTRAQEGGRGMFRAR